MQDAPPPAARRRIDHLVLAARDPAALAGTWRRMGFHVGARNVHPWGTENHIVQFASSFVELIGPGEGFRAPAADDPAAPFAGFLSRFLVEREGFAMLVLSSEAAADDARRFAAAGIGEDRAFRFGRRGRRADGTPTDVAFSLAFARSPLIADAGFFVCEQHFPENFWSPSLQRHANSATGVASVALVAENPSEHAEFLSAFTGEREMLATSMGLEIPVAGGTIEALTPVAFRFRFGEAAADAPAGPHLAAARLACADLDAARRALTAGEIAFRESPGALIVPPEATGGVAIALTPRVAGNE